MNLSFKNRIAFHYMIATAIITAIAFSASYFLVKQTVLNNLDKDLSYEAHKHTHEIVFFQDTIAFKNKAEWEEKEHSEVQVNPVFIQLMNAQGEVMDKSPNLKDAKLPFNKDKMNGQFDALLKDRSIRQLQLPLKNKGETKGYILAAMSSEAAHSVILKLRYALLLSYLIILFGLYFFSRYLAGRNIQPVQNVTKTIEQITQSNLKERVELPQHKDEIYTLSSSFNDLLDRIQNALEREKQFTSDASHELRTPLSSLRGTLEILIRQARSQEEYEEKIRFSLQEIDRMSLSLEQLLLLARLDTKDRTKSEKQIPLSSLIHESLQHFDKVIKEKELKMELQFDPENKLQVPYYYSQLIIENVLSNAVKYSNRAGKISITGGLENGQIVCSVVDHGIGIKAEDLDRIYDNFFRSDALNHKHISGNGLGLSIVKKCAEAIQAKVEISSELNQGTSVQITF
jgi:signal transduction histidine kinase